MGIDNPLWVGTYERQPSYFKMVAWNYPQHNISNATTASAVSLTPILQKVWIPKTITITNISVWNITAAVTLTAGSNRMGVYDSAGTLLSQTADITAWAANAEKKVALAAAQTIQGGPGVYAWLAAMGSATTVPAFAASGHVIPTNAVNLVNIGLVAADGFQCGTLAAVASGSGLPASFTPSTGLTASNKEFWIGAS